MGERVSWTDAEDGVIRQGKVEGLSYEQIADKLPGRTKAAVSLRAYALKLSKPRAGKSEEAAAAPAAEAPKRAKKQPAAPAAAAAPAEKPKRVKKEAPAVAAAPAPVPVAAKPKRIKPAVAAAPVNGNGHHASKAEQVIRLGGFKLSLEGVEASMEIVPGGVRYDLGQGRAINVAAG